MLHVKHSALKQIREMVVLSQSEHLTQAIGCVTLALTKADNCTERSERRLPVVISTDRCNTLLRLQKSVRILFLHNVV